MLTLLLLNCRPSERKPRQPQTIGKYKSFGMVLETHLKLCVRELEFTEKKFLLLKLAKWTKIRVF